MATVLDAPKVNLEEVSISPRKRWTRTEYRQLIKDGFLQAGKVELVNGEIWEKMGQGRKHSLVVTWLIVALGPIFGFKRLQCQSSITTDEYGDPEPDVVVLAKEMDQYLDEDPTPADTLLVVEVSNTTLHDDLTEKQLMYANNGISEYWVVDIPHRLLHVFRQPTETGYASQATLTPDEEVYPLAASETAVRVQDLLPPV